MVLDRNYVRSNFSDLKDNPFKYMVLDVEALMYERDEVAFGYSIEILAFINTVNWTNNLLKELSSNKLIDTSILYKVMDSAMTEKPFNEDELRHYFKTSQDIEDLFKTMIKFYHFEVHVPFDVELILFGFKYDDGEKLGDKKKDKLMEDYGELNCEARTKKLSIDDFFIKAKKLLFS